VFVWPAEDTGLSIRGRGFESRTRRQPSKPFPCLVNSAARVPACLVGSRGFDSRTRRQITAEIAQTVERRVEGACVGESKPSLGTRTSLVSSAGFRAPVYETGGRTFDSCTRHQPRRASSIGRAAASKAEGSRFDPWPGAKLLLDVAKRPKASGCNPDGESPRPFESDRRVHASLAQRTQSSRLRTGRSAVRIGQEAPVISQIAQTAERLAVNQEVRDSKPRRGASSSD
jgi:hypothetical protein